MAHNSCIAKSTTIRRVVPDLIAPDGRTDERLGRIVHLLTEHALFVVSGTKIAEEIGITRSAVWRLIEQLRSLGLEVTGYPATGYQLQKVPDLLLPEILLPLLRGTRFADVQHYFKIGSTNLVAMKAAAEGAAEGTVFVAEEQTAGRGRGGHDWHSERSTGIYCSAVLRPQVSPADILTLSLIVGLAVVQAIESVCGVKPDLRWPNDVLIGDRKIGGILTEMNAEATKVRYAVVGMGINVNQAEFPEEIASTATSLRIETGQSWSRVDLAAALLKSLDREYAQLGRDPAEVIERFEAASTYARGKRVHVDESGGYDGVTEGLDERGFLRVRSKDGVFTVFSGSVRPIQD